DDKRSIHLIDLPEKIDGHPIAALLQIEEMILGIRLDRLGEFCIGYPSQFLKVQNSLLIIHPFQFHLFISPFFVRRRRNYSRKQGEGRAGFARSPVRGSPIPRFWDGALEIEWSPMT